MINTSITKDVSFVFKIFSYIAYPILYMMTKTPFKGAQTTLHLCYSNNEDLKSGEYYKDCKIATVSSFANIKERENRTIFMDWVKDQINEKGVNYVVSFNLNL